MTWSPWYRAQEAIPQLGDYIQIKCVCMGVQEEGFVSFVGLENGGVYVGLIPKPKKTPPCYWRRKEHGEKNGNYTRTTGDRENDHPVEVS